MLDDADVEVHVGPDEPSPQPGEENITETTDTHGANCADDDGFDQLSVEPPEHRRRGDSTHEDVQGMKQVKELAEIRCHPSRIPRFQQYGEKNDDSQPQCRTEYGEGEMVSELPRYCPRLH